MKRKLLQISHYLLNFLIKILKNWLIITLLLIAVILILFSLVIPYIITQGANEIPKYLYFINDYICFSVDTPEKTAEMGDSMGGITSPFIGIAAVIVTGLAFYAQYNANNMVKKQFEIQKFENQFYEMLRLHKENVNEIEIETSDSKTIKGREAFFEMKLELEILILLFLQSYNKLDKDAFYYIYYKFFFGEKVEAENFIMRNRDIQKKYPDFDKKLDDYKNNPTFNMSLDMGETEIDTLLTESIPLRIKKLNGFYTYLGHYYRHLFHTVKFVVDQKEELISEEQKLNYLRLLRAQLSNYEQIMLFYNWLGDFGKDWENNDNQFFTKYKMIQNLWYDRMYKNNFIKQKLKELVNRYKELGREDNLFEIGDNIDENF